MAIHRLIQPVLSCPETLTDCTVGQDRWNNLVANLRFQHNIGGMVWSANGRRVNKSVIPVLGDYGNTIYESALPQVISDTFPLYTGMNHYDFLFRLKLINVANTPNPPTYMNLKVEIGNGGIFHQIANYWSAFPSGSNPVTITTVTQNHHIHGTIPNNVVPGFQLSGNPPTLYSRVDAGEIRVTITKFNPRASVTGLGVAYADGLMNAQLYLWRDCP